MHVSNRILVKNPPVRKGGIKSRRAETISLNGCSVGSAAIKDEVIMTSNAVESGGYRGFLEGSSDEAAICCD